MPDIFTPSRQPMTRSASKGGTSNPKKVAVGAVGDGKGTKG